VLGGTPDALQHAQLVRQWCPDVIVFSHTVALTDDQRNQLRARRIGIVDGPVSRLVIEDDRLTGVELDNGRVIHRSAAFVRPRFIPKRGLLRAIGCAFDEAGWVVTDPVGRTSVPGAWAAGNVANPRAQVITAAGEGSAAAIAINNDLVMDDVRRAVSAIDKQTRG
jgi:thioredoxin reductase